MTNKLYPKLLLLCSLLSPCSVCGFKPLGSEPQHSCLSTEFNCPSHYICQQTGSSTSLNEGECKCDRYYGFYGEDCRNLSMPSYAYAAVYCFIPIVAFIVGGYNVSLIKLLYHEQKLKFTTLATLSFNTFSSLGPIHISLEYIFTVFEVDKQMYMRQHLRRTFTAVIFVVSMLSSIEISGSWIRLTQKVRRQNLYLNKYNLLISLGLVLFFILLVVSFLYQHGIEFFVIVTPALIGMSYAYGGFLVVSTLRSMYVPGAKISDTVRNALELAYAVETTANNISLYCVIDVFASVLAVTTFHSSDPYYKAQNHLPRWAQGQVGFIVVNVL